MGVGADHLPPLRAHLEAAVLLAVHALALAYVSDLMATPGSDFASSFMDTPPPGLAFRAASLSCTSFFGFASLG